MGWGVWCNEAGRGIRQQDGRTLSSRRHAVQRNWAFQVSGQYSRAVQQYRQHRQGGVHTFALSFLSSTLTGGG